jgi:hypothetical protein
MNPIVVNTVPIREHRSQYLIRYGIEKDRFAQVLSSVTSRSVLLLGVARDEKTRKAAGTEPPYCLIAVIPLTASVDPDQTAATFEGSDLVLRLVKRGDCQSEEAVCQSPSAVPLGAGILCPSGRTSPSLMASGQGCNGFQYEPTKCITLHSEDQLDLHARNNI